MEFSITTETVQNALKLSANKLGDRAKQLIDRAQELHELDGEGSGFVYSAVWASMVGITIAEGMAIAVAIPCVLIALAGLVLGQLAGQWYYNGGDEAIAAVVRDAEAACVIIGVWVGDRAYGAICLYQQVKSAVVDGRDRLLEKMFCLA